MEYKIIKFEDKSYPEQLKIIKNPPKQLYVAGNSSLLNDKCFSIIGSRSCTDRGLQLANQMAKDLVKDYNLCIVSGLAKGIDGAAHWRST